MRLTSFAAAGAAALTAVVLAAVPATAAPGRAPSTPMCATSQLTASLGGGDAGAGNLYRYLVLTNHSATTCHLTGYPGLSMLDAHGTLIGAPATRQPATYQPVVLRPGGSASDTIHTINHQGTCLPASARLRVYPPGNRASLVFTGKVTDCHDLFSVTPLTAGRSGNPAGRAPTAAPSPTSPTSAPSPTAGRQVSVVPRGAPDTGLRLAAQASGTGDATVLAAGGGGLAAAVLGLALVVRRRSPARAGG